MIISPWARRLAVLGLLGMLAPMTYSGWAQIRRQVAWTKPRPDLVDLTYGPHERNRLDVWQPHHRPASGDVPTGSVSSTAPVVVFFHGGGFLKGDKESIPGWLVTLCLERGIAVASANYRLSPSAPYPAPMHDGARAIQYLRSRARELGIDPHRIAACGNSAGAGISLWVGFHEDLAEPEAEDRVSRESSRLACMGVIGAQSSYDPRFIRALIGGRAHEHMAIRPLYGVRTDRELDRPEIRKLIEDAAPINHVTADDPPVLLFYSEPKGPLPSDARPGQGIHHPRFGEALKARLDPLGIPCLLRHHDDYRGQSEPEAAMYRELVSFFEHQLRVEDKGVGTGLASGIGQAAR